MTTSTPINEQTAQPDSATLVQLVHIRHCQEMTGASTRIAMMYRHQASAAHTWFEAALCWHALRREAQRAGALLHDDACAGSVPCGAMHVCDNELGGQRDMRSIAESGQHTVDCDVQANIQCTAHSIGDD
jgi:hypothetical protein